MRSGEKEHCRALPPGLAGIEERVRAAGAVSLFLDFDGTLAPLQEDREQSQLDESVRATLTRISQWERVTTTILSGRAVSDLRLRVAVENLIYAGNHGMEIRGRQLRFIEPAAAEKREKLRDLSIQIAEKLRGVPSAAVEYKGLTATVHYGRAATIRDITKIVDAVQAAISAAGELFRLGSGKMAFDILPRTTWHKGRAVRWINERLGKDDTLSICLGDDETDENAFRALPDGITVRVGRFTTTSARYQLAGPPEVHQFLNWLDAHELAGASRG